MSNRPATAHAISVLQVIVRAAGDGTKQPYDRLALIEDEAKTAMGILVERETEYLEEFDRAAKEASNAFRRLSNFHTRTL